LKIKLLDITYIIDNMLVTLGVAASETP